MGHRKLAGAGTMSIDTPLCPAGDATTRGIQAHP